MGTKNRTINLFGLIFGLLFLGAGLLVFFQTSLSYIMAWSLGISTQGVITEMYESQGDSYDEGVAKYVVRYSFTLPDGKFLSGNTQLASPAWHSLSIGQNVTVKYFPHYPRYNYLAGYRLWEVSIVMMIVFPLLFGGSGVLILIQVFRPSTKKGIEPTS